MSNVCLLPLLKKMMKQHKNMPRAEEEEEECKYNELDLEQGKEGNQGMWLGLRLVALLAGCIYEYKKL